MTCFLEHLGVLKGKYSTYTPSINKSIRAGEKLVLFSIDTDVLNKSDDEKLKSLELSLNIHVSYSSVYGERYFATRE